MSYLMTATRSVSPLNKVAWIYAVPDPTGAQYSGGAGNLDLATLEIRQIPGGGGELPPAAAVGAIPVSTAAGYVYAALEKSGAGLALGVNDAGNGLQYRRYIQGTESYGTIRQGDVGWTWSNPGDVNRLRVYFQGYVNHSDLLTFDGAHFIVGETGGDFTFDTAIRGTSVILGASWLTATSARVSLGVPIRLQNLGSLPGSGSLGDTVFSTALNQPVYWDGSSYVVFGGAPQPFTAASELALAVPESDVALRVFARVGLDDASKTWSGTVYIHVKEGAGDIPVVIDTLDGDSSLFDPGEATITGSGGSKVLHVAFTGSASGKYLISRV